MHAGYWGLIGGTLDGSEEAMSGALREVGEELDISPQTEIALNFLCDVRIQRSANPIEIGARYFTAPLERGMDSLTLKYNSEEKKVEGDGLGWFTAEEVHHMWLRPEDRIAVEKFFEQSGL